VVAGVHGPSFGGGAIYMYSAKTRALGHMSFCQEAGSHMVWLLTKGARLNQHCVIVYFGGADNRC